jgi:hypothetical protein
VSDDADFWQKEVGAPFDELQANDLCEFIQSWDLERDSVVLGHIQRRQQDCVRSSTTFAKSLITHSNVAAHFHCMSTRRGHVKVLYRN